MFRASRFARSMFSRPEGSAETEAEVVGEGYCLVRVLINAAAGPKVSSVKTCIPGLHALDQRPAPAGPAFARGCGRCS